MRKKPKFHGLKKIKIRQSWNKFNLYNLSRMQKLTVEDKTFFQQKWAAKAVTRAYHGEQIKEKQWQRMFDTRIPSVQSMDPRYLAQHDGSEQAAGRGSGMESSDALTKKNQPRTPYMHMVYGPTERRLDTAIWRALFASSVRQARQFVTHGGVRVNGKKLNPGDMFQVDPDRVMFATGAMKNQDKAYKKAKSREAQAADEGASGEATADEGKEVSTETDNTSEQKDGTSTAHSNTTPEDPELSLKERQKTIKSLLENAKLILSDPNDRLSASRKQEWRAFSKLVRTTLSRARSTSDATTSSLETQFQLLKSKLAPSSSGSSSSKAGAAAEAQQREAEARMSAEEEKTLREALERAYENPVDDAKPYATPWRPRPYMSPFAFIPRYLEVNQNVCSAVYLRHPVARPGLAEVPTPFHLETSQLAFNWYLRRR
ncbi:MAG: hypothetical protein Q9165_002473 [Trypethelium subeluteriae]